MAGPHDALIQALGAVSSEARALGNTAGDLAIKYARLASGYSSIAEEIRSCVQRIQGAQADLQIADNIVKQNTDELPADVAKSEDHPVAVWRKSLADTLASVNGLEGSSTATAQSSEQRAEQYTRLVGYLDPYEAFVLDVTRGMSEQVESLLKAPAKARTNQAKIDVLRETEAELTRVAGAREGEQQIFTSFTGESIEGVTLSEDDVKAIGSGFTKIGEAIAAAKKKVTGELRAIEDEA